MDSVFLDIVTLPPDALVLTPNRRLAAWLIRDHDALQQTSGARSWPRLNALPLDQWMVQWHEHISLMVAPGERSHPRLLSPRQSSLLWRQVLESLWPESQDINGLVTLSQQARSLIYRWCWQAGQWQNAEKFEHQQFARWHQAYCLRLQDENSLDAASLPSWVIANGSDMRAGLPRHIYLHGFNDPDEPQLLQLKNWLEQSGIHVTFTVNSPQASVCGLVALPQLETQFELAIHWALQQRDSARKIGVVIPNLQQLRSRIRALCKHQWSLQADAEHHHWTDIINITAGQKLCDYPLVAQLQMLLRGLSGKLPLQDWNILLTSPYFCARESDWLLRDTFCQTLREKNQKTLYLSELKDSWRKSYGEDTTFEWIARIQSIRASGKQSVSRWLDWLVRFVPIAFGQQGRTLDSEEFQVRQRLQESAMTLQELDDWLGDIDFERFRSELNDVLESVQFQPQTETATIQIMGVLEAAGLTFDQLWVCECEAINWPQSLNPNPLLSRRIQRALNMPGASPERELQYASRLLEGFKTAAQNAMFSWGRWQGDTEHTCSVLLANVPDQDVSLLAPEQLHSAEFIQFSRFRHLIETMPADEMGTVLEQQHASGGSGIIKSQSLCPFKAFAEYRLDLRSRDDLSEGIKASDRGSFLHKVMEAIWLELKTSQQLQALLADETRLDSWLSDIIHLQLQTFRERVNLQPVALYQLEKLRAFAIAKRWLQEIDGRREAFDVIQVEKRRTLEIGGIELNLAVDRIDQLPDGSCLIIDYKTGDKDHKAWTGERPEEPQLPLYTMLENGKARGILFGVLKPSELSYKGLVENKEKISSARINKLVVAENWDQQLQDWQRALNQLAQDYREGKAEVAPLNSGICAYCHLASFCRIREAQHDSD